MGQLSTQLTMNTAQHDKAMDDSTEKVKSYAKETKNASKEIGNLQNNSKRSTKEILAQIGAMENGGRSATNYRKQLSQMTRNIADLTIAYRAMDKEQRQGAFGQEVAARIVELRDKAAEYKDAIGDVQAQITALSSDSLKWDTMKESIEVVSGAMQTFVGLNVLGEKSTEKLTAAITQMKTVEAATATIIKTVNALQKQGNIITAITNAQLKAQALAQKLANKETIAAKVAQAALNKVAMANPYVLLAAAIAAVVAALAIFITRNNEGAAAQKKMNEVMKNAIDGTEELNNATTEEIKNTTTEAAKIRVLHQVAENNNKSMDERNAALKELQNMVPDYHGALDEEGNLINDNTSALDDYITKLREAAKAQATFNTAVKLYQEAEEIDATLAGMDPKQRAKRKNQKAKDKSMSNKMLADKLLEDLAAGQYATSTVTGNKTNSTTTNKGGNTGGGGTNKIEPEIDKGSVTEITARISELNAQLEGINSKVNPEKWKEVNEQIKAANDELAEAEAHNARMNSTPLPMLGKGPEIKGKAEVGNESGLAGITPTEANLQALEDFELRYTQMMEKIDAYSSIIDSVGSAFGSLGQMIGGQAGDWVAWGGTVIQTIGQVLPQIASLVLAHQAMGESAAVASAASIGFPQNIAAIAAVVAQLIAVFASMPKFANGGYVPGNSYSGDHVMARLDSGELVLNKGQQANLFSMLDGGTTGSSDVNFVIKGDTLVGAINNYNKKNGRI